jgi:hypothetical protein
VTSLMSPSVRIKSFKKIGQLNFVVSMFLGFPLGYFNRYIKSPKARLLFGLITGMMLQYQMFENCKFLLIKFKIFFIHLAIIHVVIATITTYLFLTLFGRKLSPFYILFFNILHLAYLHLRTMNEMYGNWSLGIEACFMMSICKFSSIVFNYDDGGKEESELKSSHQRTK